MIRHTHIACLPTKMYPHLTSCAGGAYLLLVKTVKYSSMQIIHPTQYIGHRRNYLWNITTHCLVYTNDLYKYPIIR